MADLGESSITGDKLTKQRKMFAGHSLDRKLKLDTATGGKTHLDCAIQVFPLVDDRTGKEYGVVSGNQSAVLEVVDKSLITGDRRRDNGDSQRHCL